MTDDDMTKRITPDDWGERRPSLIEAIFVTLGIPLIFFILGMIFEYFVRWGL